MSSTSPEPPLPASLRVASVVPPDGTAPVNRRLFGKFTEHIHRNVYGGAWAQIVRNPAFGPAATWPNRDELLRRLRAAEGALRLPGLSAAPDGGLPPWWIAEGSLQTNLDCSGVQPAWTIVTGQGAGGGLVTPVHLPAHRTVRYRLHLHLRGDVAVDVSLRRPGGEQWARARVEGSGDWTTREADLVGPPLGASPAGMPLHLVIAPAGPGRLELRRCLLFPADHQDGWDPDVVGFMRRARLPLLRFPGGNFVSGYHWREGVGPLDARPLRPNPAWPEAEWNHVGTDEWLRLCELVGCEALVCVNAGNGTPQEAADWVEYCNGGADTPLGALRARHGHPAPYGVRLWEVGNEIYGAWQVGTTDAAGYARRYGEYARAMLARDRSIQLIANGDTEAWNRAVVAGNRDGVRALSHHCLYGGYPEDAEARRVFCEHMAFTPAYAGMWQQLTRPMREAGLAPRLAITEQQIFTHRAHLPNNGTLTEALWTASITNEAIRAGDLVALLTHSALCNHGGGLRKEQELVYAQPVWWATHLYAAATAREQLHPLEVEFDSPRLSVEPYRLQTAPDARYLDAVVLATGRGEVLVLFLVNRHPDRALAVTLDLPGGVFGQAEIDTLTGESYMAANSREHPEAVAPAAERQPWADPHQALVLPPCSLVRVRLS